MFSSFKHGSKVFNFKTFNVVATIANKCCRFLAFDRYKNICVHPVVDLSHRFYRSIQLNHLVNNNVCIKTQHIYNLNKKLIGLKQFLKFQNNLMPEAILRSLVRIVQFLTHLRCLYFSTAHNNVHSSILWVIITFTKTLRSNSLAK